MRQRNENGVWEVQFKLKKIEVNDISFLNKTAFYKDAAVLRPSSQKEIDELVFLMKNNPRYRIIIHSHSNPGIKRAIILTDKDDNYFDMEHTFEKSGSDMLLTKKRATIVRNYLINHGIGKKRIDVVGWGSKEMIVKSTSEEAEINERIEVELVAE